MDLTKRAATGLGLVVFLLAAIVYLVTLTPTVPFWDSGEFIAVSYILGVPHPPGTPFYVLLGRIATLVPWATIAQRVNALSALASAFAVLITYLAGLRLIRVAQGPERTREDEWIALAGAAIGALLLAFSDNFWENSIEAEVYSLMSLAQILVFWLGLKWWEAHDRTPTVGPLLVCVYVMWLCVGLHLGVGMLGLPLLVLVWLVDRRVAMIFLMPFLSVLFVTWGLERMAGGVLALTTITFAVYAVQKKINGWVVAVSAAAALYGMKVAFGDENFGPTSTVIAALAIAVPLTLLARRHREGRVLALALLLIVAGYSTHVYLPIRAAQHPAINEGNPSTWNNFRDLLERKQYGESSMFERRGPWSAQLDKEFWRYFRRQWPLFPSDRLWAGLLPLLLGVLGAGWQARRERTSFLTTGVLFAFATAGMVLFLNFTDHEVRDRDYFFTTGYHVFALWIGMGAAWLIVWVRDSFGEGPTRRAATVACAALLAAQPFLLMKNLWFAHDRSGNYVARDYAYNMLAPLKPNAFIVTNGDNDTFPLWYIQQVEGFRKDVRVANLSLLNTEWYIQQLRDEAPRVPITLDDATIHMLGAGVLQDSSGHYLYTNHFMIDHIMNENHLPGGWKQPPYFAVTVPEHMGLDKYFTFEGLVWRVNPDTLGPEMDEEATLNNIDHRFLYRGLFKPDGTWDETVYKDENSATLAHNYAAAFIQLGIHYKRTGRLALANKEMERVERMFPRSLDLLVPIGGFYIDTGDTARALALFERLAREQPGNAEVRYYHGVTLMFQRRPQEALGEFEQAIQLDPDYAYAYMADYSLLLDLGQRERAIALLEQWVRRHPDDPRAQALLQATPGAPLPSARPRSVLPTPPPANIP